MPKNRVLLVLHKVRKEMTREDPCHDASNNDPILGIELSRSLLIGPFSILCADDIGVPDLFALQTPQCPAQMCITSYKHFV